MYRLRMSIQDQNPFCTFMGFGFFSNLFCFQGGQVPGGARAATSLSTSDLPLKLRSYIPLFPDKSDNLGIKSFYCLGSNVTFYNVGSISGADAHTLIQMKLSSS